MLYGERSCEIGTPTQLPCGTVGRVASRIDCNQGPSRGLLHDCEISADGSVASLIIFQTLCLLDCSTVCLANSEIELFIYIKTRTKCLIIYSSFLLLTFGIEIDLNLTNILMKTGSSPENKIYSDSHLTPHTAY